MAGLATGFGDDADSMDMDSGGPSGPPQPMGGTAGVLASGSPMAGVQQNPDPSAGSNAPKRHGGLLTGLVGVLLDGLSAGIRTPQGPNGFAQSAQTASQMPQQRQQQQITFQNQQMMQKAQIAQAHVQQMQTRLLASGLDDEIASGLTDAAWKFATNSVEQGTAKMVSGTGTREAAFDKLKELHDSASPDEQGNLFAYPSGKDKDGQSQWAVYQTYPNKTLQEETKFHLDGDDDSGIAAVDKTFPAGTPMSVYTTTVSNVTRDQVAKLHAAQQQKKEDDKNPPTQVIQRKMPDGTTHNILINKVTSKDIGDEGVAGAKAATPSPVDKADIRAGKTEIQKSSDDYQKFLGTATSIRNSVKASSNGNQLAGAIAPLQGTLFITTAEGVKRINQTELAGVEGAGSIVQRAEGSLSKLQGGGPFSPKIKQDLLDLIDIYQKAKYKTYSDSVEYTKGLRGLPDDTPKLNMDGTSSKGKGGEERQKKAQERADPFAQFGGKSRAQ